MRRAWIEAARSEEVRHAARGWARARAIDERTKTAIEAAYPSSRIELHKAWTVFVFILTCMALGGIFGGAFRGFHDFLAPVAVYAILLLIATEVLRGSRIAGSGADAATSFLGVSFLLFAIGILLDKVHVESEAMLTLLLAASAAVGALAAWRWGFPFYAAAGAVAGYVLLGRMAWARASWLAVAALAMGRTWRLRDRASIAPPHRRSLAAVFAVSAAAAYTAVNLYSLNMRVIERIRLPSLRWGIPLAPATGWLQLVSIAATAVFPVVFLAWGIRARRRLLIAIGLVSAALSIATWRYYAPIGPRWAYLTACGAVLIGVALWAHRRLRDAPGGAWRGLTASPLYSDDAAGISPIGALGAHLAAPAPEPARHGFTGGGGEYGGGGASGSY